MSPRLPIGVATMCSPGAGRAASTRCWPSTVAPFCVPVGASDGYCSSRATLGGAPCGVTPSPIRRRWAEFAILFGWLTIRRQYDRLAVPMLPALTGRIRRSAVSPKVHGAGDGSPICRGAARLRGCCWPAPARCSRAVPSFELFPAVRPAAGCSRGAASSRRRRRRSAPARSRPASFCRCRRGGNAGVAGQAMRNAAEMALAEFKSPNVQLLVKDDGGSPRRRGRARNRPSPRAPRSFSGRCSRNRSAPSGR